MAKKKPPSFDPADSDRQVNFRLGPVTLSRIDQLAEAWKDEMKPLTRTAVVIEAIKRAWEQHEKDVAKKSRKKSG